MNGVYNSGKLQGLNTNPIIIPLLLLLLGSFSNCIASSFSHFLKIIFFQTRPTKISTRSKTMADHRQYGPIMQLKFGSFPVVVASSAQMAKEFLKTHDHVFASRPKSAAGKYLSYNHHNITWAPYGPYWRQGRKIYASELFNSKRLDSYKYVRVEEMRAFLSRLCTLSGKPIMLKGDWLPWLDVLDLQGYVKRMKALIKNFDQFLDHVFDEHKAKKEGVKDFVPKDIVNVLLQLADDPNVDIKLTYDNIKAFIQLVHLTSIQKLDPKLW